jgi:hypothetical protein
MQTEKEERKMKSARLLSGVLACLVAALGFSMIGCGSSNDNNAAADAAQIAQVCDDGCNTLVACAQERYGGGIPNEVIQDTLTSCLDNCDTPELAEDVQVRDCAVACDISADCGTFLACACGCGLDLGELCL